MSARLPGAILISGRGSNMAALLAAARDPAFPVDFRLVLSDRPEAAGLTTARQAGVEARAIEWTGRAAFEAEAMTALEGMSILCLAGFMRVLSPGFVARWPGRLLNIHPSLLPAWRGLEPQRRALEAGEKQAGASVHHVTAGVDEGPVIAQQAVPVLPDDTVESLSTRILAVEHEIYPRAVDRAARALIGESTT